MYDTFAVFFDGKLLVVLTGFDPKVFSLKPGGGHVLDWYAKEYAFERKRLTGGYVVSVSVEGMKYLDFCRRGDLPHEA